MTINDQAQRLYPRGTLTPMMMPMRGPMENGTRKPSICVMLAPACVMQHTN